MKNLNLTTLLGRILTVVLVGAMLGFMGCSSDDETPAPTQTILEIVQERANLSKLAEEIERAQLNATLSADGSMTLFAPSNDAMTSLLNTLQLDDFSPVAEAVAQAVLTYHIANSEILSSGIVAGNTITTLEGEAITIAAGPTLVSGATSASSIETADIKATNGVVHIVNVVLVPPSIGALIVKTLGTVAQPILLGSDFTILSSAIQKADAGKPDEETIIGALVALPDVTFFASPNAVLDGNLDVANTPADVLNGIIRKHIVASTLAPLTDGDVTALDAMTTLTITAAPGLGTVSGPNNTSPIPVAAEGVSAGNGIVYPIGGIIQ